METVNDSGSKSVLLTGMTREGAGGVVERGEEGVEWGGEGGIEGEVEGAVKGGGGGGVEGEVEGAVRAGGGGEVSGRKLKEGEGVEAGGELLSCRGGEGVRNSSSLARRDRSISIGSMFQNVKMYVGTGQNGAPRTTVGANRLRQENAESSNREVRYLRHCYAGTQKEAVLRYKQKLIITVHFKKSALR